MRFAVLILFSIICTTCQAQLSTGPASGTIPSNFKVSVEASTIDSNYNISLHENTGTLFVRGKEYTALAYWTQVMDVFSGAGVWWINVVGIAEDGSNLAIVYLDCTNGVLHNPFWEEDWDTFLFDENMELHNATHNCDFQLVDWNVPVSFPSLNTVPQTGFPTGITISGKHISLNSDSGWFMHNGNNFTIVPISTVNCFNCASNCGAYSDSERIERNVSGVPYEYGCYPGPWYEIHHAAYLKGDPDTICFGIFYLFRQDHSFLQWNYTFCMPEMNSPMVLFEANWSGRLHGESTFPQRHVERQMEHSIPYGTIPSRFDRFENSLKQNLRKSTHERISPRKEFHVNHPRHRHQAYKQ